MRVLLAHWPSHCVSVPIGLSLHLIKEAQACKLKIPYRTRSGLAREIAAYVAAHLPERQIRVLGDGGYATKEYLRRLPASVEAVSRMLITGKPNAPRRPLLGSPETLARKRRGWQPQPTEAGVLVQAWDGLWHTVLPGRLARPT